MSALETTDSPVDALPAGASGLATVSIVAGILATIASFGWVLLPLLATFWTTDAWSQLSFGIMGLIVSRSLTGLLALGAVVAGAIALRRPVGRAKAGAGTALGAAMLLELLTNLVYLLPGLR